MNVAHLIAKKRDGHQLDESEIRDLISQYARDQVPDYQMSAFAMAVYFQGMSSEETVWLTNAVIDSGQRMDWPVGQPVGDKHSTGGIGDKVSIPLAPMLACCGLVVPMISGRGLGTTGGTLDKLESIKGYRCDLSADEFRTIVRWNGCSITGATDNLAPADRKLYALRDVTGTIPSIPLITASILSKKIAEGIDSLVLDVKCGSGAFMKTMDQARELAQSLVAVGNRLGVATSAVISDMSQPLGRMVGNSAEVLESIQILKNEGPDDVVALTVELGARLLVASGLVPTKQDGQTQLRETLESGTAFEKFEEMVQGHGGDLKAIVPLGRPKPLPASISGYVQQIHTGRIGRAVIEMGGGRKQMGDPIDHSVGIEFNVRLGEQVESGQMLATLYCDDPSAADYAAELIGASIKIGSSPIEPPPLIQDSF